MILIFNFKYCARRLCYYPRKKLSVLSGWLSFWTQSSNLKGSICYIFSNYVCKRLKFSTIKIMKKHVYFWKDLATFVISLFPFSWFPFLMNYLGRLVFFEQNHVVNHLFRNCFHSEFTRGKMLQNRRDLTKNYLLFPKVVYCTYTLGKNAFKFVSSHFSRIMDMHD